MSLDDNDDPHSHQIFENTKKKDNAFQHRPQSIQELKEKIRMESEALP